MSIKIKDYIFNETGVDGVYICDQAIFVDSFDRRGTNNFGISTGRAKLMRWYEENAPIAIRLQFDISLPTAEEVFSQKQLKQSQNCYSFISRQFPIFKDSDERMKDYEMQSVSWWTQSGIAEIDSERAICVKIDGSLAIDRAVLFHGFVPVLRKKQNASIDKSSMIDGKGIRDGKPAQYYYKPKKIFVEDMQMFERFICTNCAGYGKHKTYCITYNHTDYMTHAGNIGKMLHAKERTIFLCEYCMKELKEAIDKALNESGDTLDE